MKKQTPILLLLALCFSVINSLYAQNKISINNNYGKKYNITLPYINNATFSKLGDNYLMIPEIRNANENEQTYTLTATAKTVNNARIDKIVLYNENFSSYKYFIDTDTEKIENIPAGTYDAVMSFEDKSLFFVFKEGVVINSDINLEFDMSEAVNAITYKFYDENGNELYMDEYNDDYQIERKGTADDMLKASNFVHKIYGPTAISLLNFGYMRTGSLMDFYINDISNNYCIVQGTQIMANGTFYNLSNIVTEIKTQTVANDPKDLRNVSTKFNFSSYMIDEAKAHTPSNNLNMYFDGNYIMSISTGAYNPVTDGKTSLWMDMYNAPENSKYNYTATVQPACSDSYEEVDYYGEKEYKYYYLNGCQITNGSNGGLKYIYGGFDYDPYGFNRTEGGLDVKVLPGHPELSYETTEMNEEYGNSSPVLSYKSINHKSEATSIELYKPVYIGRHGDINETYSRFVKEEYEGNSEGKKIIINNNLPLVDGQPAGNEAIIFIKNGSKDLMPPTLQMLTFKNKEGKITDRLDTNDGARMLIIGGDYDLIIDTESVMMPGYFVCKDAQLGVWCSKEGENDWQELNAIEKPELYQWPAFGYFYDVELGKADIENGWYDVKTVITDEAGNYQQQIIRRAFHIENGFNGIEDITNDDDNSMYYQRDVIIARGADSISLYTADGMIADSVHGETLSTKNLSKGFYTAVAKMNNGKRNVLKIIVK